MQGGIDPELPGTAYFDLVARGQAPGARACTCTRSARWRSSTAPPGPGCRIREWLTAAREAGLDTIPGTAAEILDDEVRWVLTKGKLPTAAWIEVVTTAHAVGLRSTSTMMYGHVDTPAHWVAHLRLLARLQDQTGGFTEFVPLPFVHTQRAALPGRRRPPGPDRAGQPRGARDGPAAAARADRQHPDLVGQARRRGHPGDAAGRRQRPRRHADGGDHLPDGRQRARLGRRSPAELDAIAAGIGRPARQRTTTYGVPDPERVALSYQRRVPLPVGPVGGSRRPAGSAARAASAAETEHQEPKPSWAKRSWLSQ